MLKHQIWLVIKCKILLRISEQHERAVLIRPSKGRSLISAIGRPFESRRWIGCALVDRLSFGHPTAEPCYVVNVYKEFFRLFAVKLCGENPHNTSQSGGCPKDVNFGHWSYSLYVS